MSALQSWGAECMSWTLANTQLDARLGAPTVRYVCVEVVVEVEVAVVVGVER